ncbi:hypothetical protein [Legionella fallonii]|uniref:Uncharacterized protein n=1 Tax=Legionella fallonii LLAP-10 TaxID=1212491 RepID=A0A098G7J2_9GAMM|nr:hypothetical protein [Legionella fallonii]CEG57976.1 conserved exported protein of unknown function [Legionella fallonii LLAP-10]
MMYKKSDKRAKRKRVIAPCLMSAFCILSAVGSVPSWAHPSGGGGFHGRGGFGGGGYIHNYGGTYHQYGGYHAGGFSGGYRGAEYYHNSLGHSPFGQMHHQFQGHPQTFHSFNHASAAMAHSGNFHHDGGINGRFAGHANWVNHGYWHGSYWHGGYGPYWAGRPYWGWGGGFFYGAFFGAAITTAFFLPPVYAEYYYYPPLYYYPGPYSYTVIVNEYPPMPAPPLRLPPQRVETWVAVKNGRIPVNAVANNKVHKKTTYYCRVRFHGKTSYGVLVPKDGCYVDEPSVSMRFSKYDVLVSSIVG